MAQHTSPRPAPDTTRRRTLATSRRSVGAVVAALLLALAAAPAQAETPTPTPQPDAGSPSASETAGPAPAATPTDPSTSAPSTSAPSSPAPAPEPTSPAPASTSVPPPPGVTLAVTSSGGPVAGAFYEDLGRFAFAGTAPGLAQGTVVSVTRKVGAGAWTRVAQAKVAGGRWSAALPVSAKGAVSFRASAPAPESADVTSPSVPVTVRDATVELAKPAAKVNSLKDAALSGRVVPARAGVSVHVDVRSGSHWKQVAVAGTDAAGTFRAKLAYGKGSLTSYTLRATYRAANRPRWEASPTQKLARVAVLDAKVEKTTSADVAKTYRKGCPVGPSKLRTVHLNYYGRDKKMHRGVMIIRTDLTQEIIRGFGSALTHRYPVAKMKNPNEYGGNDPKQMKANNTSGFNCRKVVGNPYAQSPHSYGIALDVNTVQNPYRDAKGKWWPSNGKSYIKRTPRRFGMLTKGSSLTKSLRKDDFFWGGFWNPGRDYQHFEHRG